MYVQIIFAKSDPIICISDASYVPIVSYQFRTPVIVNQLPEGVVVNTMIDSVRHNENIKSYYLDCGDLDRSTVEDVIQAFSRKNMEKIWGSTDCFFARLVSLPEKDGMPFISMVREGLVKAKLAQAASRHLASQSLFSDRTLLLAGGVAVLGVAAAVTIRNRN